MSRPSREDRELKREWDEEAYEQAAFRTDVEDIKRTYRRWGWSEEKIAGILRSYGLID